MKMTTEVRKVTYNRKEAASYLGLAENTFVKLLNSGKVKYIRVGRRVLIPQQSLDRFLEEQSGL
jgi:excisionase family DNA binding protein